MHNSIKNVILAINREGSIDDDDYRNLLIKEIVDLQLPIVVSLKYDIRVTAKYPNFRIKEKLYIRLLDAMEILEVEEMILNNIFMRRQYVLIIFK